MGPLSSPWGLGWVPWYRPGGLDGSLGIALGAWIGPLPSPWGLGGLVLEDGSEVLYPMGINRGYG